MKLTPREIEEKSFAKSALGYDKNEVDEFLKEVADEFAEYFTENEKLKAHISGLEKELEQFKKIEKNLQNTLLDAHESSQKTIENAKSEANEILENARKYADEMRSSVSELSEARNRLTAELKAIISSQKLLLARRGFFNEVKSRINEKSDKTTEPDIKGNSDE